MPTRKQDDEELSLKFSLGNAITLFVLVMGLGFAWARMEARMTAVEHGIERSNATLERIADRVDDLSRWRDTQAGSSTTTKAPRR